MYPDVVLLIVCGGFAGVLTSLFVIRIEFSGSNSHLQCSTSFAIEHTRQKEAALCICSRNVE